jgi:hypothetical protein
MRPSRLLLPAFLMLGLAFVAPARACESALLPELITEVAGQIELASRATTMQEAQIHLRRAARNLSEAEFQLATCDCPSGGAGVAEALAVARRASQTPDPLDMVNAMDDLVVLFENAVSLLTDETCR